MQQKLQISVASRQLATPKRDYVENCLADGVEHDVSLRTLVPIEVARPHVAVRPLGELLQIQPKRVLREEVGSRDETR
jgi:hypothetical protein